MTRPRSRSRPRSYTCDPSCGWSRPRRWNATRRTGPRPVRREDRWRRACGSGPRSSGRRASGCSRRCASHARPARRPAVRSRACTRFSFSPTATRDGHPMLRVRHAHGRVLRRQPRAADVEVTPTACAQTVVPAAMLPASGAPVRVARIRARRDDDDVITVAIRLDARRSGHDIGGRMQHALERAG